MKTSDFTEKDKALTIANRNRLISNRNLLLWYKNLYERQFAALGNIDDLNVLEIGSGTSPIKLFHPSILTSDILELDYLDYVLDCHDIDRFVPVPDGSLDAITMTNVLHHLKDPLTFLVKAAIKLKPGGKVIMTEPYFSTLSTLIYRWIHHEPVNFAIEEPLLDEVKGPLSSANMALPHKIFFSDKNWRDQLSPFYDFSANSVSHYTSLAYMVTGGISIRLPVPTPLYRLFLPADTFLADYLPRLFSSFFILEMTRKAE